MRGSAIRIGFLLLLAWVSTLAAGPASAQPEPDPDTPPETVEPLPPDAGDEPPIVEPTPAPIVEPAPAPVEETAPPPPPVPEAADRARDFELVPPSESPDPGARLHDGFYLRMALGLGYVHDSVDIEGFERPETLAGLGAGLEFLLGGTPARGLVLGGGIVAVRVGNARRKVDGRPVEDGGPAELDVTATALVVFAGYYLDPRAGLHGQVMLGLGSGNLTDDDSDEDSDEAYPDGAGGPALGLGVGYDLWVADQWSMGILGRLLFLPLAADIDPPEDNTITALAVLFSATNH